MGQGHTLSQGEETPTELLDLAAVPQGVEGAGMDAQFKGFLGAQDWMASKVL